MHLVLVHPEIPHNTGCAARLAAATGVRLHLVEPLGFSLEDRYLKRAGLDYWPLVDLVVHASFEALLAHLGRAGGRPAEARLRLFTARGGSSLFRTTAVLWSHEQNVLHAAITPGAVSARQPSSTTLVCVAGCVNLIVTN